MVHMENKLYVKQNILLKFYYFPLVQNLHTIFRNVLHVLNVAVDPNMFILSIVWKSKTIVCVLGWELSSNNVAAHANIITIQYTYYIIIDLHTVFFFILL